MSYLHVFDMDGTLLRNTTASLEIARRLNCLAELEELERSFAIGAINTRSFASAVYQLWGDLTITHVNEAFDTAPWINGVPEVLADIRRRGEHSLVITMSPDFFATRLQEIGVDEIVASKFPSLPFKHDLDLAGILTPADKVSATDEILQRLGLTRDRCLAYGDSISDMPLFQVLLHTVAVNADSSLHPIASCRYDGNDLREAYRLVRSRLSAAARGYSQSTEHNVTACMPTMGAAQGDCMKEIP